MGDNEKITVHRFPTNVRFYDSRPKRKAIISVRMKHDVENLQKVIEKILNPHLPIPIIEDEQTISSFTR